ncbi:MAG: hypothetical protein GY715_04985 [Planctomycetes bacterium]|nr:hypothetical protein [Planctomycetota bacterium]
MCNCCCHHDEEAPRRRRGPIGGLVRLLFMVALAWVTLVFGGGTLQRVDHPVAQEAGRMMQFVSFVGPAIYWADGHGHEPLSRGLRMLAHGIPIDRIG